MKFDIAVIGSGPGGYVAAIRAAQLGKKVAIIEKADLGGVCLNWGCIPTKALLKSAQVFDYINHAADYGITVKDHKVDFDGMIKRSRGVADGMSKGIAFLMKKNKIEVIKGSAKLAGKGKIGPNLFGVFGRQAGTYEGFKYGESIVAAGAAGLVWDEVNFVEYAQDPTSFLKAKLGGSAKSKMAFKVKDAASAADVYAYLAQFSPAK